MSSPSPSIGGGTASSSSSSGVSLDAFRWRLALSREDLSSERLVSLASAPGLIYVGCDGGTILSLAIMQPLPGTNTTAQQPCRMMGKRKMGKKAVQQMEIVYVRDGLGQSTKAMLLTLVDSKLLLLDAHSLATVVEVGPKESFSLFSVDSEISQSGGTRVCAALKGKKKLQLFSLTANKAEMIKEAVVPDQVLAMVAQGEMLALGYKREYSLLSLASDTPTDVPVPVEGISPLMARCGPNELLLATNNMLGFFVSFSGDPLPKAPLVWHQVPNNFAQCGGYILAAMMEPGATSKESPTVAVTISSLMDQKQVQSVRLPTKLPPGSAATSTIQIATHTQADIVLIGVSSTLGSEVYAFTQTSTNEQIQQYLEAGLALEAASLFSTMRPSKAQSEEFNNRAGWIALKECDFVHAFDFFMRANTDPRDLINLFTDLQLNAMPWHSDIPQLKAGVTMQDIIEGAKKRQAELPASQRKKDSSDLIAQSTATLVRQSRISLAGFLWSYRKERLSPPKPGEEEIAVWVDTALLFLLVEYEKWRASLVTKAVPSTTSAAGSRGSLSAPTPAVDASHVEQLPYTLHQLLFPSNACIMPESEVFLSREQCYLSLAALCQSKGVLRKSLDVWKNLSTGKYVGEDPEGILAPPGAQTKPAPSSSSKIPGLKETVALLSTLPDTQLLWEFAEWVLQASPMDGLRIFLTPRTSPSNSSEAAQQLPPEKVLAFLKRIQNSSKSQQNQDRHGGVDDGFTVVPSPGAAAPAAYDRAAMASQIDLVEAYLEYLIQHERTREAKYHTALALCYLGKVVKLGLVSSSGSAGARSSGGRFKPGHEPGARGAPRLKLMRFLQRSEEYDASIVLQQLVDLSAKTSLDSTRARAGSIGSHALSWTGPPTPTPGGPTYSGLDPTKHEANLYEELLLLLSRLGKHTRVLQIYLFDLKDEQGASRYAEYICHRNTELQERRKEQERRAAAQASLDVSSERDSSAPSTTNSSGGRSEEKRETDQHPGTVFLDLLEIYFSDEYAAMWKERQAMNSEPNPKEHDSKEKDAPPPPQPTDAALALLNEFFPLMDPVALLRILPPTLPLASLSHLFSRLFPATLHARRHGRLVAGMHKMVHLRTQAHCFLLRSISLFLDTGAKCSWCYKALHDAVFVAHPLHVLRDPITQQFVIDFEHGGTAPVGPPGAHDPFKEEVGFQNELPRFVLVHYQCSAPFLSNGGVDAFMGTPNSTSSSTPGNNGAMSSSPPETRSRGPSTTPGTSASSGGSSFSGGRGIATSGSFRK